MEKSSALRCSVTEPDLSCGCTGVSPGSWDPGVLAHSFITHSFNKHGVRQEAMCSCYRENNLITNKW